MIYTDGVHLISDSSLDELHAFAEKIGLKKEWFQDKRFKHYDIWGNKLKLTLNNEVNKVDTKTLIRILRKINY